MDPILNFLYGNQRPQMHQAGLLGGVRGALDQIALPPGERAQLEMAKAQQDWNRTYQGGMLDIARQNANRKDVHPDIVKLQAAGIDPKSPTGQKALFPRTDTPISATDKKAIMSAEDDVPRLNATIENVRRAMELNPQVYSGLGASARGWMGAKLPDGLVPDVIANPKQGAATAEWDQVMGQEAIKMMSETLKGASTDFEMKKFLGIAADTAQPPPVRQKAMERFTSLANEELALRKRRASELRSGEYFKPGNDGSATKPQSGGPSLDTVKAARANQQATLAEAKALITQRPDKRDAIIQRLKQAGIDPMGL